MSTTAIINGDKILCGKCLNKLGIIKEFGSGAIIEVKCSARKNGINCATINEIILEKSFNHPKSKTSTKDIEKMMINNRYDNTRF